MSRRALSLSLVAVAAIALLWWSTEEPAAEPAAADRSAPEVAPTPSAPPGLAAAPGPEPTPEAVELSPVAEAVVALADLEGHGWVRCVFDRPHTDPPIDNLPMLAPVWEGAVVTGGVFGSEGKRALRSALEREPFALMTWSRAVPGEQGRCVIGPATRGPVRVQVVDGDGAPTPDVTVDLCGVDHTTDAEGRAVGEEWTGGTCFISAGEGWVVDVPEQGGLPQRRLPVEPTDGELVVVRTTREDARRRSDASVDDLESWFVEPGPDPIEILFEQTELHPDGRAHLQAVLDDRLARRAERQALIDRTRAFMEANPLPE